MHYYQFNIADYRKDTTHLSRLEHSIYRDLIDWCYLDEAPIPLDLSLVKRKLRICSTDDEQALKSVLTDFFECTNEGYTHKRIAQEIAEYYAQKANASKAGKASAEARKIKQLEQPLNDRSTNHKPLTINQEPFIKQDKPARSKKTAHALPDDFAPDDKSVSLANDLGINWIAELPKFRDHHLQKGTLGKDWNAGFRTWLNNAIKFGTAVKSSSAAPAVNPVFAGAL
jgi:uncharacterized protein YdaU (DUF1376 family)